MIREGFRATTISSVRKRTSEVLFKEELATPSAAIRDAITAANYADNGAPFDPFLIKFAEPGDFTNIWTSEKGNTAASFYKFANTANDGFLPLGDYAAINGKSFDTLPIMLFKAIDDTQKALKNPDGFIWILDDNGSHNDRNISYWWPYCNPPGPNEPTYLALGIVVTGGETPTASNYWCVNTDYLQDGGITPYWNDAGQNWKHHSGNLSLPVVTSSQVSNNLLLAPTTMLSDEYDSQHSDIKALSLVVKKLFLPVPGASVPSPVYDDKSGQGTSTAEGIINVAVLPCNVITDANLSAKPGNTPFYYLAGQPYWECTNAFPSPAGGTFTQSYTVGTSTQESKAFQNTNSITVGADVGIEAGDSGGFSAHMSVSYTHEMQVTTSTSVSNDTEVNETLSLNLPIADRILVWQYTVQFITYRAQYLKDSLSVKPISQANYQTSEITFTPKPATPKQARP